jgi:hypothetical protein
MKRAFIAAALFPVLAVLVYGQEEKSTDVPGDGKTGAVGYERPDPAERRKKYLNSLVGPAALARIAATSAFGTIRNRPEEWGKNAEGFGRRFASGLGENAIRQSFVFGLDEALKVDSGFYRSKKRGLRSKISNAVVSTFTARNAKGKRVVGVPRIVGAFAAPVIAREAWYPDRFTYRDGLRSGAISLGINAAVNLFRELIKK